MRILYIHQYFRTPDTGWGLRSWHIARHWAEQGHEVFVVTAYEGPAAKTERHGNLTIKWLPIPYRNSFPKAQRIAAFRQFVGKAIQASREFLPADLVYATSTPLTVGLVALWLKWRHGIPFVFEVRDLWPEAPIQLGMVKGWGYKAFLRRLEQMIYAQSLAVVALSPPVQKLLAGRVSGKKVLLAPNFSDSDFFHRNGHHPPDGTVHVCYAGTFGLANDIPALMAFARAAQAARPDGFRFHLAGEGQFKLWAEGFARDNHLANTTFHGHLSTAAVRDLLHGSHFAWVGFRPEPILQTNSPNKFFDALASGTPILLSTKGWLKDMVETDDLGFCLDAGNTPQTLLKMEDCVRSGDWPAMSRRCGTAGERYSKENTLAVLDEVISNREQGTR